MPDEKDPNEATTHADLYQRHEQSQDNWEKAEAVTGRPADVPPGNSTLASRAKELEEWERKRGEKQVDSAENKAVPAKRSTRK